MKTLSLVSIAVVALSGCVVLPAEPYRAYGYPAYSTYPAYVAPAPVVVTPSIFVGSGFRGHHHGW